MSEQFNYKYKVPFGSQTAPRTQNFQASVPAASASSAALPSGAPAMQGDIINPEVLKQKAQDSYVANRVGQFEEIDPIKLWSVGLPAWYVAAQSMDVFAKASRGTDYSKTVQGRVGNLGDKISGIFTDNKVAKSSAMQKFGRGLTSVKNSIVNFAFKHSAALRAMKTPSLPELDAVKGQANGMRGFLLYDYPQVAENFLESVKHVNDLDCYGADKAFIEAKKNLIKNGARVSEVIERAEFELLLKKKDPAIVDRWMKLSPERRAAGLKNLKARALGFDSLKHFESIVKGDIQTKWKELLKACEKANPKMYSKVWSSDKNWWTKLKGHVWGRRVYMSEFRNKLISATGQFANGAKSQKSKLGRFLPKIMNYFLEGATNRVAGGKFVALMNATILAEVLIRTANAEKGDKVKTFMERTAEMIGFFVFAPIALRLLHIFGGEQYAGISDKTITKLLTKLDAKKASMGVDKYNAAKEVLLKAQKAMKTKNPTEAYREAFNFFNDKATSASYATRGEHKAAKKALKNILKGDTWNPVTKLLKKIARFLTVGLEQPAPFRKKALVLPDSPWKKGFAMFKDCFKHPKYWFKQGAGYPVRFLAVMMIIMPILNKFGVKFTHSLFGRPSKSILDKESDAQNQQLTPEQQAEMIKYMEDLKKQQEAQKNMPPVNPDLSRPTNLINMAKNGNPYTNPVPKRVDPPKGDTSRPTNLINMANRGQMYKNELSVRPVQEQPVKAPEKKEPEEPLRTYVPSSEPVQIKGESKKKKKNELSEVDLAMKKTEEAEKLAMQTLAMK